MNNLLVRGLTGVVFVTALLGSILWNEIAAVSVISLFWLGGILEFYRLFRSHPIVDMRMWMNITFAIAIFMLLVASLYSFVPGMFSLLSIPLVFVLSITELWRKKKNPIINMAVSTFALVYLVTPFVLMIYLHHLDQPVIAGTADKHYLPILAGFFILVWANDTFAYLTGMLLGKTKLFESISPKKTWEGTIGGILFTILAGYLISLYTSTDDTYFWIIGAAIIAPFSTLGDLLESQIKRSLKVKDSGSILPGHGGILDRFDAAMFSIPIFASWVHFYVYFFNWNP